jgi:hypothetical protein
VTTTAPTIVSTGVITGSSSWGTDKPKINNTIAMNANDLLVVIAIGADYGGAGDDFSDPTGGGMTFALRQQHQLTLNSFPWGWTGQSGSNQTVTLSVTVPTNSPRYGAVWAVVRGSDGYDSSAKNNGTAASSIAVTTTTDKCCLIMGIGDWDAVDGAARVYRTVNGITPVAGGAGEISYQRTVGEYTTYGAVWSDAGAAGSKTVGFTAPSGGTVKWAGVVIAMKGSAGGTTFPQSVAGAVTPSGALIRQTAKRPAGTLTPAGALLRRPGKQTSGAVTPAGAALKQTGKLLAGGLTPAGAVASIRMRVLAVAGSLVPGGALLRQASTHPAGTVGPFGAVAKTTARLLAGTLVPAGVVVASLARVLALAGALAPAGALLRSTAKTVGGAIVPAGALRKLLDRALARAMPLAGAVLKRVSHLLGGTLAPAGTVTAEAHAGPGPGGPTPGRGAVNVVNTGTVTLVDRAEVTLR